MRNRDRLVSGTVMASWQHHKVVGVVVSGQQLRASSQTDGFAWKYPPV